VVKCEFDKARGKESEAKNLRKSLNIRFKELSNQEY
jgi:hypothetical protein